MYNMKCNNTISFRNYSMNHIDVDVHEDESNLRWNFTEFYEASYVRG